MNWSAEIQKLGLKKLARFKKQVDETFLSELESALGVKLASDYRSFILEAGSACLCNNAPIFQAGPHECAVELFFGAEENGTADLLLAAMNYRGRIPPSLLPIGNDAGGNLILLGIAGEDYGKIFYWDHDDEGEFGSPHRRNVHLVADSFSNFVEKMRVED